MANRFELFGSKYGKGADGLYNYVKTSEWFANSVPYMSEAAIKGEKIKINDKEIKVEPLNDEIYTSVYEVLVLGKRKLPL